MNTSLAQSGSETKIEFFSSHAARAAKKRKVLRRRIVIVLIAAPKIIAMLYFGHVGLTAATAADRHLAVKATSSFQP